MERELKSTKNELQYTAVFAMIVGLLISCHVSLVTDQWRARIFLVLNFVLLAVLFTSLRFSDSSKHQNNGTTTGPQEDTMVSNRRRVHRGASNNINIVKNSSTKVLVDEICCCKKEVEGVVDEEMLTEDELN